MKVYCIFYTDDESNYALYLYLNEDNAIKRTEELNLNEGTNNYHYRDMPIEDFEEFESKANDEGFKKGVLHMVHSQLKLLEE